MVFIRGSHSSLREKISWIVLSGSLRRLRLRYCRCVCVCMWLHCIQRIQSLKFYSRIRSFSSCDQFIMSPRKIKPCEFSVLLGWWFHFDLYQKVNPTKLMSNESHVENQCSCCQIASNRCARNPNWAKICSGSFIHVAWKLGSASR